MRQLTDRGPIAAHVEGVTCPACRRDILPAWRYCTRCGARLGGRGAAESAHRVTVVVSDLQGSTALAERLDPESLRDVLDQYFDELGRVLESYGGRIEKRIGDAMVTVFGLPRRRRRRMRFAPSRPSPSARRRWPT